MMGSLEVTFLVRNIQNITERCSYRIHYIYTDIRTHTKCLKETVQRRELFSHYYYWTPSSQQPPRLRIRGFVISVTHKNISPKQLICKCVLRILTIILKHAKLSLLVMSRGSERFQQYSHFEILELFRLQTVSAILYF